MVRFSAADVVRHPLVGRIVEAYEGPGRMMLEIAIDADGNGTVAPAGPSSPGQPSTAAIAESAFPQLGSGAAHASSCRCGLTSDEEVQRAELRMAGQGQADQRPVLPDGRAR